jgi:hypothetical protein
VHYQYKGKDTTTGFNRSQLMQLTIAALPRGSDVMWCVLAEMALWQCLECWDSNQPKHMRHLKAAYCNSWCWHRTMDVLLIVFRCTVSECIQCFDLCGCVSGMCLCCRLHFALTICYNFWVMWVLARYFKDFVLVRQHYLSKGGW